MRREKDSLKLEKNENFITYQRELEELKNKNREV